MTGATLMRLPAWDGPRAELVRFAWRAGTRAFAAVGLALAAWVLLTFWSQAGHDALAYWLAGGSVLAGESPYSGTYGEIGVFRYAPPLAVVAAAGSLLPFGAFQLVLLGVNVAALRYVAGSWRVAGLVLLYPWSVNELLSGNINFPIAAALYASFRSTTAPLALAGLAKLSTFLVVPQLARSGRDLRPLIIAAAISAAITIPFLQLWPEWVSSLSGAETLGGALPIPLGSRLVAAAALLGLAWYRRREWMAALGAAIAVPVLWPSALVIFLAPIRLFVEQAGARPRAGTERPAAIDVRAARGTVERPARSLTIVLPAYDEAARIGPALGELFGFLRRAGPAREGGAPSAELGDDWSVLVVDDGSTDATAAIVLAHPEARGPAPRLRLLQVIHGGKGAAVRAGMLAADTELAIFADADMATPPDQLPLLTRALESADLALGSRIQPDGSDRRAGQPAHRRLLGRVFHALAAAWVTGPVPDTQCGFKGFRREAAHDLFARQRIGSIVFDAEIIHLARRRAYRVAIVPVEWSDRRGSRLRTSPGLALHVLWDLLRIPVLHRGIHPRSGLVRGEPAGTD